MKTDDGAGARKPNCWTCIYCGFHYFHSSIELSEVVCRCGKGMGRWVVDVVAERGEVGSVGQGERGNCQICKNRIHRVGAEWVHDIGSVYSETHEACLNLQALHRRLHEEMSNG
jgi:hypothetical protein